MTTVHSASCAVASPFLFTQARRVDLGVVDDDVGVLLWPHLVDVELLADAVARVVEPRVARSSSLERATVADSSHARYVLKERTRVPGREAHLSRGAAGRRAAGALVVTGLAGLVAGPGSSPTADASSSVVAVAAAAGAATPIRHVVVIFQENHSFDNVLGGICISDRLDCDGTTSGLLHTGRRTRLATSPDIVPNVQHRIQDQRRAINGGRMNGFDLNPGCSSFARRCYTQYRASQIPNLRSLAESFVISDRTFSTDPIPSWGQHLELVAAQLGGFQGVEPTDRDGSRPQTRGWGCDSQKDSPWKDPKQPRSPILMVPSCIPRADGFGPYRSSPVKHIPTILDRLSSAGLSWRIYADTASQESGYVWSICPTFASCLYDPRNGNRPSTSWTPRTQFMADARAGQLPAYAAIMPSYELSQHNSTSMTTGDNYIASLVGAVMDGPSTQWESTVIFITYDDCGCFYDHVPPPAHSGLGIRVPMVIVSPQAKASFVDHTQASFNSTLAFVETNWRLKPLTADDARAYDYCRSFVFTSLPCTGPAAGTVNTTARAAPKHVRVAPSRVPAASLRYARTHAAADPDDPT